MDRFLLIVACLSAAIPVQAQDCGWSALYNEFYDDITGGSAYVSALTAFDDGTGAGAALYAGGRFVMFTSDLPANNIARWNGSSWSRLGSGLRNNSGNSYVGALTEFDDGTGGGPALYAGGFFTTAGWQFANNIARWDGSSWSPLGSGVSGGASASIARLTVFEDGTGGGPALYAGGWFETAGGQPANSIAKWDGSSWSPLGSGLTGFVRAMTVFDDGTGGGAALYAGGHFTTAGGQTVNHIARWDGSSWSPLGSGVSGGLLESPFVNALAVFDDGRGGGPSLYAGGFFTTAGGQPANCIARWDGSSWSALGSGVDGGSFRSIYALAVFDDGTGGGEALYAGGSFTTAGGQPANCIARWNGSSWSSLGSGVDGPDNSYVAALTVFDDNTGGGDGGAALYGGGDFFTAGGQPVNRIAKWACTRPDSCPADMDGNGLLNFFDLSRFISLHQQQGPGADFNGDGVFNFFDFSAYLAAFNAGCP